MLSLLLLLVLPAAGRAATVTVEGGTIRFDAEPGEANTAVIARQAAPNTYYVGDLSGAPVTPSGAEATLFCSLGTAPAATGLPPGQICTVLTGVTALEQNLDDRNDTGVIGDTTGGPRGTLRGGDGDDTLVGGTEDDAFAGGTGTDSVAYVGVDAAGIDRTAAVEATLPASPGAETTSNGQAGEDDRIQGDVEGLVGGNGDDALTGNDGPNTIAGAAPAGTPHVDTAPAGHDTIVGQGGNDQLLAGDSGSVAGGAGDDQLVGGRSATALTVLTGAEGADTLVSGLGDDDLSGGAGADTLAYVSVSQGPLTIVDRGTNGVTARLPDAGTAAGGRTGGAEDDVIRSDLETLIGSNGDDTLTGSNRADTIVGAAPAGTPGGVRTSPAGVDAIAGGAGGDSLVAGDSGSVAGGLGADNLVGGRSTSATTVLHGGEENDTLVSGLGDDEIFGDAGANTLAYASVQQGGLDIVSRGTAGVTAALPNAGGTTTGGRTGGAEQDRIHPGIRTLVGSNGDDALTGSEGPETIVGVAPAGTAGVAPGPAGDDRLHGAGGVDLLLGAAGADTLTGGTGLDSFIAGAGNDRLFSRDASAESPSCGAGTDTVTADPADRPAADCEQVDRGTSATTPPAAAKDTTPPRLRERSAILVLRSGRRVTFYLSCRNEAKGCRGTFVLRTRYRKRVGTAKARRYTLARVPFRIAGNRPKRFRARLSRTTLKLVRRHRSIRLTGIATARDTSGNRAAKSFRLRLKRP